MAKVVNALKAILRWFVNQLTFSKLLVAFLVFKGVYWVDQSYALAWAGHIEIASDLSQKALVELLGVALLYSAKALFEQLSKHNTWPDKSCSHKKDMNNNPISITKTNNDTDEDIDG